MTMHRERPTEVVGAPAWVEPSRLRVALVGADGAGKSTVSERLGAALLPVRTKRIYMGVNLEASSLMLPTTRVLLAAKRARGGRPDLVATRLGAPASPAGDSARRFPSQLKDTARMSVWILEEWLRHAVATGYSMRGFLVVFDRHFFADYYHSDVASGGRGGAARLHGWMLRHAYPRPDLVICLDAPAEVLYARKPEAGLDWLDDRRRQYLALANVLPDFVVVDADRPVDVVVDDVASIIRSRGRGEIR